MAIQAGLVGLPNVGKSTLFNALTKSQIPAENYPFCTVDPHAAFTAVPDERLVKLAHIFNSKKIVPATMKFVDIAGLVKGASQGEGLGNQFLSNVMEVDLILHVLRCFDDEAITHVHGSIDPIIDFDTIVAELCLKDLESTEKRLKKLEVLHKKLKHGGSAQEIKRLKDEQILLNKVAPLLERGDNNAIVQTVIQAQRSGVTTIPLLTAKKFLIIANVSEDEFSGSAYTANPQYQALIERFGSEKVIAVSAKIESELAQMDNNEAHDMMKSLDIRETGLDNIIRQTYYNLGLITFFTAGPKEAHAWPIQRNTSVPAAAGSIHSDLERGFICAEVYRCEELFIANTEAKLKTTGKVRTEGKHYIVDDGDVIYIRFNV